MQNLLKFLLCLVLTVPAAAQTMTNAAITNSASPPVAAYVMDDKHVLEPGDVISLQILEDQYPATNLVVTDSSELNAPYIGRVSVDGKTCRQLAAELKKSLEKTYYYHATVVIGLDSVNKVRGQAYIAGASGAIHASGEVDILFNKRLTAGEAILMLGGYGEFAEEKHIQVFRKGGGAAGKGKTFIINMEEVQKGKADDIVLEPGDLVYVPARLVNF